MPLSRSTFDPSRRGDGASCGAWLAVCALLGASLAPTIATLEAAPGAEQAPHERVAMLHVSDAHRRTYLATGRVWTERPLPTPEALRRGPANRHPMGAAAPDADTAFPCTYLKGGTGATGRTEKFTCRTADGRTLRVKYYDGDPRTGNREVFSEVAATRLFWALGFEADAMFPVTVRCLDCPASPMTGRGPRATREFVGVLEAYYEGTIVGSDIDLDQGWSYSEVASAVAGLPAGSERVRQQIHYEALALLSTFVQHGDRKPSQQRLVCAGPIDPAAGDVHPLDIDGGVPLPAFFERDGATACESPMLVVQDLGATFGGAGQMTPRTSKASLRAWSRVPVFEPAPIAPGALGSERICRGSIVMAMSANPGHGGEIEVHEAARRFLHERLSGLTRDHLRALFEAARITRLEDPVPWRHPATGETFSGIDAWTAVFEHKVAELGAARCRE